MLFVYVAVVAYLFVKILGADVIGDARARTYKPPRKQQRLAAKEATA